MTDEEIEEIKKTILLLKAEHKALETKIIEISSSSEFSQIEVQRLKKQKLKIKDQLTHLENMMYPDSIA